MSLKSSCDMLRYSGLADYAAPIALGSPQPRLYLQNTIKRRASRICGSGGGC